MELRLPEFAVPDRYSCERPMKAGEILVARLDGPGCIRHLWFCPGREAWAPRNVILRIYFDDEPIPYVEAPLGDLFGVMHGQKWYPINTPLLSVQEETGYNLYIPMPFAKGARIEAEVGPQPTRLYMMVDWHRYPGQVMEEKRRFCARWRHENPTRRYSDEYLILDADGPGDLIGYVYGVRLFDNTDRWSHGGADNIYIDGETPYPAYLRGIGGEDSFGTSFGGALHHPETHLHTGMPCYFHEDIGEARPAQRVVGYRFFANDAIPFRKSVHMRFGCMQNDICSTVYWYSEKPVRPFFTLPPFSDFKTGALCPRQEASLPHAGDWRLFGPLPLERAEELGAFMEGDAYRNEQAVIPLNTAEGYGPDARREAWWVRAKAIHGFVDFRHFYRVNRRGVSPTEEGCGYAVCSLQARSSGAATVYLSWDDRLVLWGNGHRMDLGTHHAFRTQAVSLPLHSGKNLFALALTNTLGTNHGGWAFAFSGTDAEGNVLIPSQEI